jgi:hypothetical protein
MATENLKIHVFFEFLIFSFVFWQSFSSLKKKGVVSSE